MTDYPAATRRLATRWEVRLLAVLVAAELALVGAYFALTPAVAPRPRYALYPFVWVDVALLAVLKTDLAPATRRQRWVAGLVAGLYLLALLYVSGFVGVDLPGNPPELVGLHVGLGSPGWERVALVGPTFHVTVVPFRLVGYLALAFLVYATLLDTARAALAGAIGLGACVGCSFPILASLATGLFGSTTALTGAVYSYSVDLSTATFLLAVGLLYWRPGFGTALGQRME